MQCRRMRPGGSDNICRARNFGTGDAGGQMNASGGGLHQGVADAFDLFDHYCDVVAVHYELAQRVNEASAGVESCRGIR